MSLQDKKVIDSIEPLLVRAKSAAALCSVSPRKWAELQATEAIPGPVRLDGCVLWRLSDLKRWIELGCPNRERFEKLLGTK